MSKEIKTFDALNVSSKFAICGLPIRVDTYKTCGFGCKYCFSNCRKIMEFEKELAVANLAGKQRIVAEEDVLVSIGVRKECNFIGDINTVLASITTDMRNEMMSTAVSKNSGE